MAFFHDKFEHGEKISSQSGHDPCLDNTITHHQQTDKWINNINFICTAYIVTCHCDTEVWQTFWEASAVLAKSYGQIEPRFLSRWELICIYYNCGPHYCHLPADKFSYKWSNIRDITWITLSHFKRNSTDTYIQYIIEMCLMSIYLWGLMMYLTVSLLDWDGTRAQVKSSRDRWHWFNP